MIWGRPVPPRTGATQTPMAVALPAPPYRIALVGAGRVGTAVAELMRRSGHKIVGVASATPSSGSAAAHRLQAATFDAPSHVPDCDIALLGTPDDAIEPVARDLAGAIAAGTVVVHSSGSLGIGSLAAVEEGGGLPCALHPVQACPDVDTALRRLPGSAWGVTCFPQVQRWAGDLVQRDLGGTPFFVEEADRPLWHAAAVVTSNGIASLLAMAEAIMESIGIEHPEHVLGPLAAATVANARAGGAAATLTGPIPRGESTTIARHLDHLAARVPHLTPAYVLAARSILAASVSAGRVDDAAARKVNEVLEAS